MSNNNLAVREFTPLEFAAYYRAKGYWQGQTLGQWLTQRAEIFNQNIAIVDSKERLTYCNLHAKATALAGGFYELGIRKNDRVILQMPSINEFFIVLFALAYIGAIPVLVLPSHRTTEIVHFCQLADAKAYIIADKFQGFDYRVLAEEVQTQFSDQLKVIVAGQAGPYFSLSELSAVKASVPISQPKAQDILLLQLSGGSTGVPKLIPRTHDDYLYSIRASAEVCRLSTDSVYLCVLPVAHNFPLSSPGTLGTLHAGGKIVLAADPSPDTAFSLIAQEKVTITAIVPPLALPWLHAAVRQQYDLSSLQVLQIGGSKLSEQVAARISPTLGCKLQQVFGMAEGLVNYTGLDDPEEIIVSTQGKPLSPDDEILIVDDEDNLVTLGEVGHLLCRGPYTIRSYYPDCEYNLRAFTHDGFYRTGDLVSQTKEGYLIVHGRQKDQINRGGEKISAQEIENVLLAHPAVYDVAVVAIPDLYLGERSCAIVILNRQQNVSNAEIRIFFGQSGLADYKIPDYIEFVTAFPKTHVGKTNKKQLRTMLVERSTRYEVT